MYFCEIICFGIFFIYFFLIISYTFGFLHIKTYTSSQKLNKNNKLKLSVLIPFKNEKMNLHALVSGLKQQTLPDNLYEIIFINDHSDDKSETFLSDLITGISNFKILSLQKGKKGKKQALKEGVQKSENKLIVTSDADCRHPKKWLETIYKYYSEFKPKMITAPVKMNGKGFFGKLQALDFLSLTASTAGASGIGHPIMCNGANLIYEKSVFNEFEDPLNIKEKSGDDVFLLHSVKQKYKNDIHYLKSNNAVIYTQSETTLKSFFKQRIRWASKSSSYKDFDTILVSLIVFFTNFLLILAAFASISEIIKPTNFLLLFLVKFTADTILLLSSGLYFKQKEILFYIPFLSIIHPFYIVFTGIAGLFSKNKKHSNV